MTQSEQLGDDKSPAACAMRDRIREQFTERYNEHAAVKAELDALTASIPAVNDPTLPDELPYAPGLLPDAPDASTPAPALFADLQAAAMTTTSDERSSPALGAASEDQISRGSTQVTGAEPWFVRAENLLLLTVASFTHICSG